jgi:hypothetical protein
MARVEVSEHGLTIHMEGIDRFLAMRRRLDIPLDHIVSVEPEAEVGAGLRGLASRVPGVLAPRTLHQQSGRPLLAPPALGHTLAIGLWNERYQRVVVNVEDPHAAAGAIRRAVQRN